MSLKTAKQHNAEACGEVTFSKIDQPYSRGWRWIGYDEQSKRIDLKGLFSAKDLRVLADWMDKPTTDIPKLDPL